MTDKTNDMLKGEKNYYANLGSKLIKTPLNNPTNIIWNKEVNRLVNKKDIEGLLDMNQTLIRKR